MTTPVSQVSRLNIISISRPPTPHGSNAAPSIRCRRHMDYVTGGQFHFTLLLLHQGCLSESNNSKRLRHCSVVRHKSIYLIDIVQSKAQQQRLVIKLPRGITAASGTICIDGCLTFPPCLVIRIRGGTMSYQRIYISVTS